MADKFKLIRRSNTLKGIKRDIDTLIVRYLLLKRKKIIENYFKKHTIRKLHVGSNVSLVDGWLCSDIKPQNNQSIYLDATKRFPFEDNVLDYIYSEHMIEHIPYKDGLYMLSECFRVLKSGGKIRIGTPDIEKIINIYSKRSESFGEEYEKWIIDKFVESKDYNPLVVVNTMFRNWYHCFMYDSELLTEALRKQGFSNITKYKVGESDDENLKNIEQHHKNVGNKEMVEFETMIFEAQKTQ